jgi:ComF family protein
VNIGRFPIRCFSAGRYSDPVLRELLHLYKYGRVDEAGEVISRFLVLKVGRHIGTLLDGETDPVVVAVPMNPVNRALRGFNQAELLACSVSRELELETADEVVRRRFAWRPQARLTDIDKRAGNISGAFTAGGDLGGRDVMLVDDVITTGATVRECATALAEAGAGRITVVTALKG